MLFTKTYELDILLRIAVITILIGRISISSVPHAYNLNIYKYNLSRVLRISEISHELSV